jgi:putative acetyltransferase
MELIREEAPADLGAIRTLNAAAFKTDAEARLVDALREHGRLSLSLVAVEDEVVVGHIAFSPITITRPDASVLAGIGLGPMAVTRSRQRCGIGTRLVRTGLERLRVVGHRLCVVLGHPEYYPRFGFKRASEFGIRWERIVPDEHFFALELTCGALRDVSGVVRYSPEFATV